MGGKGRSPSPLAPQRFCLACPARRANRRVAHLRSVSRHPYLVTPQARTGDGRYAVAGFLRRNSVRTLLLVDLYLSSRATAGTGDRPDAGPCSAREARPRTRAAILILSSVTRHATDGGGRDARGGVPPTGGASQNAGCYLILSSSPRSARDFQRRRSRPPCPR